MHEILMNVSARETRVAIVEEGVVQELHIERTHKRGLVGNLYFGKILRVMPGMQAAFVDIGLERAAFLHASGIIASGGIEEDPTTPAHLAVPANITDLIQEGQSLVVQVIKDPLGSKGARLSTRIALLSHSLVYMPDIDHTGVSQKIEEEHERERLRALVGQGFQPTQGGYIVRTAAEGTGPEAIEADKAYLHKLWTSIQAKIKVAKLGSVIHEELPLALRAIRDWARDPIQRIRIDHPTTFEKAQAFAQTFVPSMVGLMEYYQQERPIFDCYNIEDDLQKALQRRVFLKSGGSIHIDQTEAMTTIDVNTGSYVGAKTPDETIFKTNLEATQAIGRHLRLRNLGGIIIIDFIDMMVDAHKEQVLLALTKVLANDSAKTKISQVSALGLVEMTRKRTRESLAHILCGPCPACQGSGSLKTIDTMSYEIFREIVRLAQTYAGTGCLVIAAVEVAHKLLEETTLVAEWMEITGKVIQLQADPHYAREQFQVVPG